MPTVMREEWRIKHGFAAVLIAFREVPEDVVLQFADMSVGIKHFPLLHISSMDRSV
jgi:hypothetical protein